MYPEFPWWTPVSESDCHVISDQLGKSPRGLIAVARRCRFGAPQVLVTSPVVWGAGRRSEKRAGVKPEQPRVFPTLYWLSCPQLVAAVSHLEGRGFVRGLKAWLEEAQLIPDMAKAHERAAQERLLVVNEADARRLQAEHPAQWLVLRDAGVGGMRDKSGVKCLHLHLADYLAGPVGSERIAQEGGLGGRNPVGARVFASLLQEGVDVRGWPGCEACTTLSRGCLRTIAAVDVGTNSCRLLQERLEGETLVRDAYKLETTRLGEGLASGGKLTERAQERTEAGLAKLLNAAPKLVENDLSGKGASSALLVVGTAALRKAGNASDLLVRIWESLGVAIRVISGQREAALSFRGALAGLKAIEGDVPVGVVDIGGGSTEFVVGTRSSGIAWATSVPVGAVRLAEEAGGNLSLADLIDLAKRALQESWEGGRHPNPALVAGVGGTWTTLAAVDLALTSYEPDIVTGHVIAKARVRQIGEALAGLSLKDRMAVPGLQPERADIIIPGIALALATLDALQSEGIVVCDSDLLVGLVNEFRAEFAKKC